MNSWNIVSGVAIGWDERSDGMRGVYGKLTIIKGIRVNNKIVEMLQNEQIDFLS